MCWLMRRMLFGCVGEFCSLYALSRRTTSVREDVGETDDNKTSVSLHQQPRRLVSSRTLCFPTAVSNGLCSPSTANSIGLHI
ncbi:hypothetical protein DFH29DRAFT_937112 [Suillus ampliporus]|nr:hypothetical protein DFH29DRAFT_937112 [Suillus ampliporus]